MKSKTNNFKLSIDLLSFQSEHFSFFPHRGTMLKIYIKYSSIEKIILNMPILDLNNAQIKEYAVKKELRTLNLKHD